MNTATKSGADKNCCQEGQVRRGCSLPRGPLTEPHPGDCEAGKGKRRHTVWRRWMWQGPDLGVKEWESTFTTPPFLEQIAWSHPCFVSLLPCPGGQNAGFHGLPVPFNPVSIEVASLMISLGERLFTRKSSQEKSLKEKLGCVLERDSSSETVSAPIKTELLNWGFSKCFFSSSKQRPHSTARAWIGVHERKWREFSNYCIMLYFQNHAFVWRKLTTKYIHSRQDDENFVIFIWNVFLIENGMFPSGIMSQLPILNLLSQ